jgi:four helix bundle protein
MALRRSNVRRSTLDVNVKGAGRRRFAARLVSFSYSRAPVFSTYSRMIPVRRLRVFEKTVDFAVRVNVLTRRLPLDWQHLAQQARRSSCSIALNLSEGCSQQGAEQRRYFRIARGSAWECDTTIHILARAGAIPPEAAQEIEKDADVISAMISSLIIRSERAEPARKLEKKKLQKRERVEEKLTKKGTPPQSPQPMSAPSP